MSSHFLQTQLRLLIDFLQGLDEVKHRWAIVLLVATEIEGEAFLAVKRDPGKLVAVILVDAR